MLPWMSFCILRRFCALQCSAQDLAEAARRNAPKKRVSRRNPSTVSHRTGAKARSDSHAGRSRAGGGEEKSAGSSVGGKNPRKLSTRNRFLATLLSGDVARRFRKQKQSQKLQQSAEFNSSICRAPALASPKPPVMPMRPPVSKPAPPRFAPYQPPGGAPRPSSAQRFSSRLLLLRPRCLRVRRPRHLFG